MIHFIIKILFEKNITLSKNNKIIIMPSKRTKNLIKEILSKRTAISNLIEEYANYKKFIHEESLDNGIIFPCFIWKEGQLSSIINSCDAVGKTIPEGSTYLMDIKDLDKYLGIEN